MSTVKKNPGHRCRKRKVHDPQLIIDAIQEVKSGRLSIRKAAKQFQIPASTLFNKLTCKSLPEASKMLLTMKEEAQLAKWLVDLSQLGVVKTSEEVRLAARDIMAQRNASSKSRNQLPSYTWLAGFYGRHPELALGIERGMITPQELSQWFSDFKAAVDGNDVSIWNCPERIFGANELVFTFNAKNRTIGACRRSKHVYKMSSKSKARVTVLACASAGGHYIPPLLIYPYKRMPSKNRLEHFPEASLQVSENGCINATIFNTWIHDSFIPATQDLPKPVVLLVDGHTSRTSLIETSQLCARNQIILYRLLPHGSHLIQPLDHAFFGAIKPAWSEAMRTHKSLTGEDMKLESFALIFNPVWKLVANPDIAAESFSTVGIYPFNPEKIIKSGKIDPSSVYHATDSDSPDPKDASSLTISPKALTSPAALPSINPLEGLTSVITSTSLDSNEASSPISLLIEASLVNVAPKSRALPETSAGNITSETPALPEASSLNTLSMGPGTSWSIPAESTNLREPSSSLSSPSQAHTSNKTSTTSMQFQTPTTSNASTPKEMTSQRLKALKDLCFFVADEISRQQLVKFLTKLSDSQAEDFSYPKDESQFHKFEELSHALLDLCHQDPPTKAKITEDDIFKIGLPSFKVKINTSSTPTLPSLVNGEECIEECIEAPVLRRTLKDKDDIEKEKMCKKLQKEEKRKKKEEEKEQKRLLRETKKLERQKKKEKQPKKKLKLRPESEDIDSDEDPVLAVRMEAEMTACDDYRTDSEDDLPNDLCKGCNKRDGTPMIQCQICDTRWHTSCAKTVRGLSPEQLKEVCYVCFKCCPRS
ncbi:uncharacterized protein LOC106060490 isoform X2 [Biomphalaria glabrata]|nr:uncharacterized protein LOC106060490 isoform X2 [Biomphalaria glabrata]